MTADILIPLVTFCFVTSVTPGPNNMMLMASGANFGFRATVPHMLGISLGHAFMVALVGFGLAGLFTRFPVLHDILKVTAVLYMLWLAWHFAHAAPPGESGGAGTRPMSFLGAAAFQWVNPKAWAMALGAITAYAPDQSVAAVLTVAAVFCTVNLPSISLWTIIGQEMRRLLTSPVRLRMFNWTMAALLLASLIPVLRH